MSNANDLVNGTVEVGKTGLVVDDRFRIGGAIYIENQSGKSFIQFVEGLGEVPSFGDLRLVLTALALQRGADISEADIHAKLDSLEVGEITAIFGKLKITEYAAKNSPAPEPATLTEGTPSQE